MIKAFSVTQYKSNVEYMKILSPRFNYYLDKIRWDSHGGLEYRPKDDRVSDKLDWVLVISVLWLVIILLRSINMQKVSCSFMVNQHLNVVFHYSQFEHEATSQHWSYEAPIAFPATSQMKVAASKYIKDSNLWHILIQCYLLSTLVTCFN